MVVLRAIGRFFARIGRWIKETAWVQPLLIVGGIFAIIFSIPYLTKWVKSWFNDDSAAQKYYSNKKLSLKNADKDHGSEVDELFNYLKSYSDADDAGIEKGSKKFGDKFFVALVQEECANCDERYGGFKTLEENWGKGSFDNLDGEFKLYTIFVDTKNDDGDNLFEEVYDRQEVTNMFEETISYMSGEYGDHPYAENIGSKTSYISNLENLTNREEISTPTIFLIDMTNDNRGADWTSTFGVREVLFSFDGTNGSDDFAKARTLRNAWTNTDSADNMFTRAYKK